MSSNPLIPHFSFPFRMVGGRAETTEQDSIEEIAHAVEVILRYPRGYRIEDPGFGLRDQLFLEGGVNLEDFRQAVLTYEPRANVIFELYIGNFDELIARVKAIIRGRMEGRVG